MIVTYINNNKAFISIIYCFLYEGN